MCILQGPVAAKHAKVKDETIKDIFGSINASLIEKLLQRRYGGDESKVPTVDYLGAHPAVVGEDITFAYGVKRVETANETSFTFGEMLPELSPWLDALAGPQLSWLRAFVTSPTIVQGRAYIDNPIRRLLTPRSGQKVVIGLNGAVPSSLTVYGGARSYGDHGAAFKAIQVQFNTDTKLIDLTMFEDRQNASVPLHLQFEYKPSMGYAPIHEIAVGRNSRIKEFYWKLWYGDDETLPDIDIRDTFSGPEITIEAAAVERFCAVVGNQDESFQTARNSEVKAPMDFAIVTGWKVCEHYFFNVCADETGRPLCGPFSPPLLTEISLS